MYDQFRKLGIPVKLTRTTDETVSPTERTQRILDAFGNNNDIIVISNHINSGGSDISNYEGLKLAKTIYNHFINFFRNIFII